MAEHYIRMAKSCKDQTVATKLHEMSKDELRHYDFFAYSIGENAQ